MGGQTCVKIYTNAFHLNERVEFQARGSPHEHIFIWLKNAPVLNLNDPYSKDICIEFIDTFITCLRDEQNPYIENQKHRHKRTFYKKLGINKKCRFNIPLPVFPESL